MNCFGIPNAYFGFTIRQGADDRFYATPEGWDRDEDDMGADTWRCLRDMILGTVESNASGTPRWETVSRLVDAERCA